MCDYSGAHPHGRSDGGPHHRRHLQCGSQRTAYVHRCFLTFVCRARGTSMMLTEEGQEQLARMLVHLPDGQRLVQVPSAAPSRSSLAGRWLPLAGRWMLNGGCDDAGSRPRHLRVPPQRPARGCAGLAVAGRGDLSSAARLDRPRALATYAYIDPHTTTASADVPWLPRSERRSHALYNHGGVCVRRSQCKHSTLHARETLTARVELRLQHSEPGSQGFA